MKLNHLITNRSNGRIIREFGEAKLIRQPDGKHELIGGNRADAAEANEWVSLFAHEIVFSRPECKPNLKSDGPRKLFASRLR
jgi:hypothetical protein